MASLFFFQLRSGWLPFFIRFSFPLLLLNGAMRGIKVLDGQDNSVTTFFLWFDTLNLFKGIFLHNDSWMMIYLQDIST